MLSPITPVAQAEKVEIPRPILRILHFDTKKARCPNCHTFCSRENRGQRRAHHLGSLLLDRPVDLEIRFANYYCPNCQKYFVHPGVNKIISPYAQYTHAVKETALAYLTEQGLPLREASWALWRHHRVFVPFATLHNWVLEAGGKNRLKSDLSPRGFREFLRLSRRR